MTFGFKNVNGVAFDIKLLQTPTGRFPSERTVSGIRSHIIDVMNKHGRRAERIAKEPGWSPFLTGALVRSIKWLEARKGDFGRRVISGALTVGVSYGRRQEFEHSSRSRYLGRALDAVFPDFVNDLRDRRVMEDIFFARRQVGGDGVRGGRF
jgi:hypothetical protein